jgi:hypothetical protein
MRREAINGSREGTVDRPFGATGTGDREEKKNTSFGVRDKVAERSDKIKQPWQSFDGCLKVRCPDPGGEQSDDLARNALSRLLDRLVLLGLSKGLPRSIGLWFRRERKLKMKAPRPEFGIEQSVASST